jgi:uncharacterized metal-binding protein YceD (DUF177 family)
MGKFDEYNINLREVQSEAVEHNFLLDNNFFAHIDGPEVQKGKVNVKLTVRKTANLYELRFHCEGKVIVPCDRCLDEMDQPIVSDEKLKVKFGEKFSEEGNDVVIVPEADGAINVAWFLYEFIALAIPMKHVHPTGKCNKSMTSSLKKHLVDGSSEEMEDGMIEETEENSEEVEEDKTSDPRWNELKKLIDNN